MRACERQTSRSYFLILDGSLRILILQVSDELYPDSAVVKHVTETELCEKNNIENYLRKKKVQTEGLGPFSVVKVSNYDKV